MLRRLETKSRASVLIIECLLGMPTYPRASQPRGQIKVDADACGRQFIIVLQQPQESGEAYSDFFLSKSLTAAVSSYYTTKLEIPMVV